MGEHGQAELLEVVLALRPPGRFSRRLHGRQQQPDEDADDRDDHQEFDQGEGLARTGQHCAVGIAANARCVMGPRKSKGIGPVTRTGGASYPLLAAKSGG